VNYQSATGLRCFEFSLGFVFAATPEEAEAFATENGLWNRRTDGTWGNGASEAHAQLCKDQQAAYRALARRDNEAARRALAAPESDPR
jgi:hypothetical protein